MRRRVHPLFPSINEIKNNPQWAYSDHLPTYYQISSKKPFGIISANVLGPNSSASGLHEPGEWESDDQSKTRYQRIALGIKKCVDQNNVKIVALQEVDSKFMEPILREVRPGFVNFGVNLLFD